MALRVAYRRTTWTERKKKEGGERCDFEFTADNIQLLFIRERETKIPFYFLFLFLL
jgi:hypothetical protein